MINDYIVTGYAVDLSKEVADSRSGHAWYLPHHGVINPNKSKVHVVYDAAAEYQGTSLNQELLQCPQLNNSLYGVLFQFRKGVVAVASDLESMFHGIGYAKENTDALGFFWWSGSMEEPPNDYKMTVNFFGNADSTCIASWAVQKTARDNESEFERDVCKVVSNKFNVNDGLFSVPTTEQAVEMSLRLIKLLQRGSFRLTMFVSNVKKVLSAIPAEERIVMNMYLD